MDRVFATFRIGVELLGFVWESKYFDHAGNLSWINDWRSCRPEKPGSWVLLVYHLDVGGKVEDTVRQGDFFSLAGFHRFDAKERPDVYGDPGPVVLERGLVHPLFRDRIGDDRPGMGRVFEIDIGIFFQSDLEIPFLEEFIGELFPAGKFRNVEHRTGGIFACYGEDDHRGVVRTVVVEVVFPRFVLFRIPCLIDFLDCLENVLAGNTGGNVRPGKFPFIFHASRLS